MSDRVSLISYDLLRELCDSCRGERFHFVPMGDLAPAPGACSNCGAALKLATVTDTSIWRLITKPDGEVVVVPVVVN